MAKKIENAGSASKKRKQSVDENATPPGQKRRKQDATSSKPQTVAQERMEGITTPAAKKDSKPADEAETSTPGVSKKAQRRATTQTGASSPEVRIVVANQKADAPQVSPHADAKDVVDRTAASEKNRQKRARKTKAKLQRIKKEMELPAPKPDTTAPKTLEPGKNTDSETNSVPAPEPATAPKTLESGKNTDGETKSLPAPKPSTTPKTPNSDKKTDSETKSLSAPKPSTAPKKPASDKKTNGKAKSLPVAPAKPQALVVSTEARSTSRSSWTFSPPAGGRFLQQDPVFVKGPNGQDLIAAATPEGVQLLSLDTSLLVSNFKSAHAGSVACFGAAVRNADTSINIIDSKGWITSHDVKLKSNHHTALDTNSQKDYYSLRSLHVPDETTGKVVSTFLSRSGQSCDIHFSATVSYDSVHTTEHSLRSVQIVGDNAEYVVAFAPSVVVVGVRRGSIYAPNFNWVEIPQDTAITSVDARLASSGKKQTQQTLSLAVGNAEGHINLYNDISRMFGKNAALPAPRVLHWHREAVSAIKISRDGNYLISGGKETVLVLWQLETGKRQFLPHLTSEIERIVVSPDGDKYAVQMGDNSIMVLSTSELKPVANFAGLQMPCQVAEDYELPLPKVTSLLHPKNAHQLLLTVPATQPKSQEDLCARPFLQTFDLRTSRHITRQALTRNNITDFQSGPDDTPITPPDVPDLAISHDGKWLATVDEWIPPASDVTFAASSEDDLGEERLKRKEVYLKFWQWDDAQQLWTLTSRIDAPHARAVEGSPGAGEVLSLVADPASSGFATAGEDSRVKIWRPKTRLRHGVPITDEQGNNLVEWVCRRTVELEREEDPAETTADPAEAADVGPDDACLAFSPDGSMLAASVVYQGTGEAPLVHFIDANQGEIRSSRDSIVGADLVDFAFLNHYFIALSGKSVRVWDVVQDKLKYHVRIPEAIHEEAERMLAVNPVDGTFAITTPGRQTGSLLEIYTPKQTQYLHREILDVPVNSLLASIGTRGYVLLFANATIRTMSPTGLSHATSAVASAIQAHTLVDEEMADIAQDSDMPNLLASASAAPTAQKMLEEDAEDTRAVVRPEQLASIFDVGDGYALPPVKDLFRSVLGLYAGRPTAAQEQAPAVVVDA